MAHTPRAYGQPAQLPHTLICFVYISISFLQGLGQGLPIQMNLNGHPLFLSGYIRLCIELGNLDYGNSV